MKYSKILKSSTQNMIEELERFISIDSVYDKNTVTKEHPFGQGVANALEYIAKLGEANGFEVDRCDGYCTELTIGDGDMMIGIFAHADVVPATGTWKKGPFEPYIEKGNMYGRGSSDDKGPFMSAFYAVLALKDAGLIKGYKIRLVAGGDEERGSGCLDYYFNVLKKPNPTYGFTPDADFPLIYGEKGINDFFPSIALDIPHVISIKGGAATNAVCDRVEIELDDMSKVLEYCRANKITHKVENDKLVILGKSAHGSTPALGDNAALKTMAVLGAVFGVEKLTTLSKYLSDTTGKSFDGFCKTKLMGETTYCVGLISYEKGMFKFSVNFRYPETVKSTEYKDKFDAFFGTTSTMGEESHYLLFDPKTTLIKTLMKAYRKETFDFIHKPMTIGGGTYAKHCQNTVAFGTLFPGRKYVMHQANEYMPIKDVIKAAKIYARAIYYLGNLK